MRIHYIRDEYGGMVCLDLPDDMSPEVAEQVIAMAVEVERLRGAATLESVLDRVSRARIRVAEMHEISIQW